MIAAIFEAGQPQSRRRLHIIAVIAMLVLLLIARTVSLSGGALIDFNFMHLAAQAALSGNLVDAYDFNWFNAFQTQIFDQSYNAPFSYPPPFAMLIAPFGLLRCDWAFLLYMAAGLIAYLIVLRHLAGPWLPSAITLLALPIFAVITFGQSGLLTGALAGWACIGLARHSRWAGVPLGLMIIKPHLAIGFAVYVIISRDWRSFWTAGAVVTGFAALSALVFGLAAWQAFFEVIGFASGQLPAGLFPFYLMVSVYAIVRSMGGSADAALVAQLVSASIALAAIFIAHRRLPARQAIGITAIATMMISPYAFYYDLLIAGAGLAMLLPDIVPRSTPAARSALYALFSFAAGYSLVMRIIVGNAVRTSEDLPIALAGIGVLGSLAMVWRILHTARQMPGSTGHLPAGSPQ